MAKITFGSQKAESADRTERERAERERTERSNVPDFLRDAPEGGIEEILAAGGFIRIHGSWVYVTRFIDDNLVATAKMKLPAFASWLAESLIKGIEGWDASPTWGTRELPKYAKAQWAAPRFGVVIHPEGESPPYTRGAFLSVWAAVAVLSGGAYPSAEDWAWTTGREWHVPEDFGDAPIMYKNRPVSIAITELAESLQRGQKGQRQEAQTRTRQQQQLFADEEDPF